jgi:flagellar hook-associated protein 3 FlgL
MQYVSIGDLAQSFLMKHQSARLKSEMLGLSQTLASGRHEDMAKALRGEFAPLASIENGITALSGYRTATSEFATLLSTAQAALGTVQDMTADLAPALISAGNSGHPALVATTATDARQKLDGIVSALNVRVADRSVFGGQATDRTPLLDGAEILTELGTFVAGATTADEILTRVADWFRTPGGGFETVAYKGSVTPFSPIPLSERDTGQLATTALDPGLRPALEAVALAALVDRLPQLADPSVAAAVMTRAGERMLESQSDLAILRSGIGSQEARTEAARVRNEAELAALKIARSDLYSADPYETATQLQLVQAQLESVYTMTARLARLSLSEYLK